MKTEKAILYYIHDPMCSWCWAFQLVWQRLIQVVEQDYSDSLRLSSLLGGLAADSDVPMSAVMQVNIKRHWQTIQQQVPGTMFNFDFWHQCVPRRSTYPACRAIIAARQQVDASQASGCEAGMTLAIQQAYYLQARNPSDVETLLDLATGLHLDGEQFRLDLDAPETQAQLLREMRLAQAMGAYGFPSLIVCRHGVNYDIRIDYNDSQPMLAQIESIMHVGCE